MDEKTLEDILGEHSTELALSSKANCLY